MAVEILDLRSARARAPQGQHIESGVAPSAWGKTAAMAALGYYPEKTWESLIAYLDESPGEEASEEYPATNADVKRDLERIALALDAAREEGRREACEMLDAMACDNCGHARCTPIRDAACAIREKARTA